MKGALGWRPPADRSHEKTYALTTAMPYAACPVVAGVPWYTAFDTPVKGSDGWWWIGTNADWGSVRGGHAICLRPPSLTDLVSAWDHYNQGQEGACVGFACSRAASLMNRRLYDGFSLYRVAQTRDPWPGEAYSGTSVNAGLNTLRIDGAWRVRKGVVSGPHSEDRIVSFLWARTSNDVVLALQTVEPFVRVLNSWGRGYPREVRLPVPALARLLREGGEFGVPTDLVAVTRRQGSGE